MTDRLKVLCDYDSALLLLTVALVVEASLYYLGLHPSWLIFVMTIET